MHRKFTALQVTNTQMLLLDALGRDREVFTIDQFVSMLSDEIEELRATGRTDEDIATLMSRGSDDPVKADDVRRFYAPPEDRRRGPGPNDLPTS